MKQNFVFSDDSFDPRGMEHVYLLVNTFLDLIQRKNVLPKSELHFPFDFGAEVYLAIVNTDFLSCFLSSLSFTHFGDTQEADFLWSLIY